MISICSECGEKYKNKCRKCYLKKYKTPLEICSKCGKLVNIFVRNPKILCRKCYMLLYNVPKKKCIKCEEIKSIHKNTNIGPICSKCYKKIYDQPKKKCISCNKFKKLTTKELCCSCRNKKRMKLDSEYAIRTKLRKCVSKHIRCKNMRKSINSIIDYYSIIEYLGDPPGKNYHIDHIFPLKAFDLKKEIHIKAAFAPENHQWLLDKENMSKKDTYDENEFIKYIKKFLLYQ